MAISGIDCDTCVASAVTVTSVSVLVILRYCVKKFIFQAPSLKDYKYPYVEPDWKYKLKYMAYLVREWLFWRPEQRFNKFNLNSSDPVEAGMQATVQQIQLESHVKDLSNSKLNNKTMDEISFMGVNLTTGHMLDVSVARISGDRCDVMIHLVVPSEDGQIKEFESPSLPTTETISTSNNSSTWSTPDLNITCLRPLTRWKISFNGFLKEKNSGEVCHVVICYVWCPYTRVLDNKSEIGIKSRAAALAFSSSAFKNTHAHLDSVLDRYDHWGTFYGYHSIKGEKEVEIPLWGCKMRRTGEFSWRDVRRFIQIKGYVEDGSVFSFNAFSLPPDLPQVVWGYVDLAKGDRHIITKTDFEFVSFEEFEELLPVLSIRFETDHENYVLDVKLEEQSVNHHWGSAEKLTITKHKATICLKSEYHDLRLKGSGSAAIAINNGRKTGSCSHSSSAVLLREPDVELSETTPDLLDFSEELCKSSKLVGGKGSSLAMLNQIKDQFKVPPGFCVTLAVNNKFMQNDSTGLKTAISRISNVCCGKIEANIEKECEKLKDMFQEATFPDELKQKLKKKFEESFGETYETLRFAVRSSAAGEDGEEMSAAGQMETILGCRGLDQICKAIKKCWASCYSFRAVEYRKQNGQIIEVGMGVVIQQMVNADMAGVLFTRDPVTGNPEHISIAANYGIGESVVSAISEPDNIVVNRTWDNKLSIGSINVGAKEMQVYMDDKDGVKEVEDKTKSSTCCITTDQALALANISLMVEKRYGNPRDIEWAICNNEIYLLQARPITNLHAETETFLKMELNGPVCSDSEWGTSGNFKEVFCGAASPLSLTLFVPCFIHSSAILGLKFGRLDKPNNMALRGHIMSHQHRFNNRGETTYSGIAKNPSAQIKQFMSGVDLAFNGRIIDDGNLQNVMLKRSRYMANYSIINRMYNSIKWIVFVKSYLNEMKKKFQNFEYKMDKFRSTEEMASTILFDHDPYSQAMIGHVATTVASMTLNSTVIVDLLGKKSEVSEEIYGDFAMLLAIETASESVESADVPAALQMLADEIIETKKEDNFVKMTKEEGLEFLSNENSPLKASYDDFITKHGHRCVKEFDVISKTWSMEPAKLIVPLQALVRSRHLKREKKLTVDEALDKLKTKMTPSEKKKLRTDVLRARNVVGLREQSKSLLIRTVDAYRKAVIILAKRMVAEGRIPDTEIIFFMTVDEIVELIKTRSASIIQRAMKRKRLFPKLDKLQFPEINIGIPYPINTDRKRQPAESSNVIKGTPVSRGVVDGIARVVTAIEDAHLIEPGDILITHSTDIAWSPYFPSLSGVVTELGGLISHGAVVAREYGIPCVVSVVDATLFLKSGDSIRLNGDDGTIEKLSFSAADMVQAEE